MAYVDKDKLPYIFAKAINEFGDTFVPISEVAIKVGQIISNLPTVDVTKKSEWIDINEKKPKTGEVCIIHYVHSYCDNDGYYAMNASMYDGNDFYRLGTAYKVTHWMPLPEPPKVGDK